MRSGMIFHGRKHRPKWCAEKTIILDDFPRMVISCGIGVVSVWLPVEMLSWDTDNPPTSLGILFRVSFFVLSTYNVLFLSDSFWKGAVIPMLSPRSEFAVTLMASYPEDAFIDVVANSISGTTMLSIALKIAFWILASPMSTMLHISLSVFSLYHPS